MIRFDHARELERYRRDLDRLGREVFPRAMATLLNRTVAGVHRDLTRYTETAIDRPNAFTKKAWSYVKAKPEDRDNMFAEIKAKPAQAQYLWFLVYGGTRRPGDIGTNRSARDIFSSTSQETAFGGIDRKFIKKLGRQLKAERTRREKLKEQRDLVKRDTTLTPQRRARRLAALRYEKGNRPAGIFVGTVKGVKGFWQRPRRNDPAARVKLLVGISRETKHNATFDYAGTVQASFERELTPAAMQASLEYERRRARLLS